MRVCNNNFQYPISYGVLYFTHLSLMDSYMLNGQLKLVDLCNICNITPESLRKYLAYSKTISESTQYYIYTI
jgi:hypothetical protein